MAILRKITRIYSSLWQFSYVFGTAKSTCPSRYSAVVLGSSTMLTCRCVSGVVIGVAVRNWGAMVENGGSRW